MNIIFRAIKSCLTQYASWSGRATRAEYWIWVISVAIINHLLILIELSSGSYIINETGDMVYTYSSIFSLLVLLPSFTVGIRRLHDVNRSGWWWLLAFTIIGIIPIIYWHFCKSFPEDNKYGPVSKL